jgi:hypothetical protein
MDTMVPDLVCLKVANPSHFLWEALYLKGLEDVRDFFEPSHVRVPLNKGLPRKNVRDEGF